MTLEITNAELQILMGAVDDVIWAREDDISRKDIEEREMIEALYDKLNDLDDSDESCP